MRDQMVAYLTDIGALSPLQSGFRPGDNTVTALLNITDDIYEMVDQDRSTLLHWCYWIFPRHLTVLIMYCCVGRWRVGWVFLQFFYEIDLA
jgi:hypothetical protein